MVDTIITDVRYIITGHIALIQAMLTLMITDLNTEVKDIAVRRVSTIPRKTNEPASQGNISSKAAVRLILPIRIATDRKPSGYGKAIRREAGNPQPKGKRARKETGRRRQQLQTELNRIITEVPETVTIHREIAKTALREIADQA
jgi:hypothetical protein